MNPIDKVIDLLNDRNYIAGYIDGLKSAISMLESRIKEYDDENRKD